MTCFGVRRLSLIVLCVFVAPLALWSQSPPPSPIPASIPLAPDAPFTVGVSTTTLEGGPVYVADNVAEGVTSDPWSVVTFTSAQKSVMPTKLTIKPAWPAGLVAR